MAKKESVAKKKRGRGILCFLLGIIFAIIAEVAVIAAGVYWLYTSELSTIFATVGIENTQEDETTGETNYVYIDTSEITTVSALISQLRVIAGKGTGATLNDLGSFPIVSSLIDSIYSSIAGVLGMTEEEVRDFIDEDELYGTPINGLLDFCVDCMKDLELSALLQMSDSFEWNDLYLALAYGAEAGTVTYNDSVYVVYYDTYVYNDATDTYTRSSDGTTLSDDYTAYLYADTDDYKLYFAIIDGNAYIAERTDEGYSLVGDTSSGSGQTAVSLSLASVQLSALTVYGGYSAGTCTVSGDYYYDADGEVVGINATTLRQIMEEGLDSAFDNIYISSFIADTEENQAYINALEGVTLGDLLNDGADFADLLSSLTIEDVLGKVDIGDETSSGKILAYLTYGIGGLELYYTNTEDGTKIYTAVYHAYTVEEDTSGTAAAGEVQTEEDEDVDPFVDYDGCVVYVLVSADGKITGVYTDLTYETQITSTCVSNASDRMDGIMNDLTIGELIDTTGSVILNAISDSTINSLADDIDNLAVQEVFYEDIYEQTVASSDETDAVANYNIAPYYKAVYESVKDLSGTFYLYTVTTVETTESGITTTTVTTSIGTFNGSDITYYINGNMDSSVTTGVNDEIVTTTEYTIYWAAGDGETLYEVVMFNSADLYMTDTNGSKDYVEYYTLATQVTEQDEFGNEVTYIVEELIRGRIDDYDAYAAAGNDGVLYTYGTPQATWYFMLYSDGAEYLYSVDDINALISNAADNIENATLDKLVETHMLTSTTIQSSLDKPIAAYIMYNIYNGVDDAEADYYYDIMTYGTGYVTLGSLTLSEAMDALVYILTHGYTT